MLRILLSVFSCVFFITVAAKASPQKTDISEKGERCRFYSYDQVMLAKSLSDEEKAEFRKVDREKADLNFTDRDKAELNRGGQVFKKSVKEHGVEMGYVFSVTKFDPELVMGVFSSAGEHKGKDGLGDFIIESKMLDSNSNANPFRVRYEQYVDIGGGDNGVYVVSNTIKPVTTTHPVTSAREEKGYILRSRLLSSNDAPFAPRWFDAYLYVEPLKNGSSYVVACNYMVPRAAGNIMWGITRGIFNGTAEKRLKASGVNLTKWVSRVTEDEEKSDSYRMRLQTLILGLRR